MSPRRLVLVVDDDDDLREVTCLILQSMGQCEVVDADRGAKAIEVAAAEKPNLILLDVMMPGMDGITAARTLAQDERTQGIPVVLLTAKAQVAETWSEVPGVVAAVIKPFEPRGLVAEVDRILTAGNSGDVLAR